MLALRCALLTALLAAPGAALTPGGCPAPEVLSDVVTARPGANVTLTCPGEEPGDSATIHWLRRNRVPGSQQERGAGVGGRLLLRSVQLSDSGNYSCYRDDGSLAGTVPLLVEAPPEEPQITCFRKSPLSKVACGTSPTGDSEEPCRYFPGPQTFSCQLAVPEGDNSLYVVSLCVSNAAGSKSSHPQTFEGYGILQPDPPVNVTVTAVPGNPRWLRVTWRDPPSWNSYFYRLQFELRYRAERVEDVHNVDGKFSFDFWTEKGTGSSGAVGRFWKEQHGSGSCFVKELQHHCIIYDAWRGARHRVQVRAREEFGHGSWSAWSPEAAGSPWTEPRSPPAKTEAPPSTQAPTTKGDDENNLLKDSANATSLPVQDSSVPLPTFLVAGGSLAFGTLLCVGLVLRFRKTWKLQALKEGKASTQPPYALGQLVPDRPQPRPGLVPLLSPPVNPGSLGSDNTSGHGRPDARGPRSAYDVTNRDYFLPR